MLENKAVTAPPVGSDDDTTADDTSRSSFDVEKMGATTKEIGIGKPTEVSASRSSLSISPLEPESKKPEKKPTPAILILLRSPRLLSCLWGVMAVATLGAQFDSVLPIHVSETFSWTSTAAGLAFLPITLTAFLSPIVGWGVDRIGPRWFAAIGFAGLAVFEAIMGLVVKNSMGQKVLLCALLGLIGICFDLIITPLMVEITSVIEEKETQQPGIFGARGATAQAYGLFNTAWAMGSLIGPIWAGFVNERSGWQIMTASLAVLSMVSVIPATIWTGGYMLYFTIPGRTKKTSSPAAETVD
jgi:MFS family permease